MFLGEMPLITLDPIDIWADKTVTPISEIKTRTRTLADQAQKERLLWIAFLGVGAYVLFGYIKPHLKEELR